MKTIKDYFKIQELVCNVVYEKFGERSWKFFDNDLLETLLVIREAIGKPITINNWNNGGRFTQRGLRHNLSRLVTSKKRLYLSPHIFGKGIDFDVKGMSAPEVREWLVDNQEILPYKIRLERKLAGKPINWVHLDTLSEPKYPKVYQFDC